MENKYRVLRIVATIWKVLAWIVLVVSVLGGCGSLAFGLMAGGANTGVGGGGAAQLLGGAIGGVISAVLAIFFGVLYFLFLYAFAELVDVVIALEANTRSTADQLKNLAKPT